jgi:RNA polymerase primary sigma factor
MKLKLKKAPRNRKVLSPKRLKIAKRPRTANAPKIEVVKARVVGVRPARKPALPGKGAVLVALKKKERAAELARLEAKASAAMRTLATVPPTPAATAGNIVPLPENLDPENEEPTQEALAKEEEVKPVTIEEIRQAYDGDTAYQLYLKEIGQTALLTIEEENALAARIKRGDKAARERMIKANLRLVVKIARDYEGYGVPLLDLISEGNIGLMKGVERFDPTKGAKLSTYSAWWIKQAIKRALANQGKTIRLPVHVVDKLFHIRRAEARLQEAFGREATDEEIASELDTTPEKIRELRTASQRPASLEAPLGYDSDNRVADVVADDNAEDPYEELEGKANTAMLREVMKDLDPREVTILRYRFGLDGDDEKTLEEVGRKFGLTRERIRQIQEIALKKLRKKIEKMEQQRKAA